MISHSIHNRHRLRRHDLIFVSSAAWRSLLKACDDVVKDPLVESWVDRGWPLVARRPMPSEPNGIALGLPLPPFAGKRRLSFLMQQRDIVKEAPPPELKDTFAVAPQPWRPTLFRVADLASRLGLQSRVFGSLAWQTLTGLNYLSVGSDLDLLLSRPRRSDLGQLTDALSAIEAAAPMRLDGEIMRDDGAGVNWRELHAGAREVLVKTTDGLVLLRANAFLSEET